jgi:DNA-directed RNA polymerase subunit RPC12/RpoP
MPHPNCVNCGKEIAGIAYSSMKKKGYLDERCNSKEAKE